MGRQKNKEEGTIGIKYIFLPHSLINLAMAPVFSNKIK